MASEIFGDNESVVSIDVSGTEIKVEAIGVREDVVDITLNVLSARKLATLLIKYAAIADEEDDYEW